MDCVRGYSTAVPYTCPSSSTSSSFFFHHRRARRCRRTYFPQHQHGVFHVLLVLDSINTNVVVQSRTTLPPPLPSPYTLAKPQKPPTHPTIPRGKTYNSIGKNPHKKHRKKTPKNTKKKGRCGVAHDGVQSFPRIIPFQWCHQERRRRQSPYWFDCWVEGA